MTCLFCNMIANIESIDPLYADDNMLVLQDINPQAPVHLLVIPKQHIASIDEAELQDQALLGQMVLVAQKMARIQNLASSGYRLVFNVKADGGQTVQHIHLHILGGRSMHWPPG